MPELPEYIEVHMGSTSRRLRVTNVGECRDNKRMGRVGCGASLYWCETGKVKGSGRPVVMPVNVASDDDDIHLPHHATCPHVATFREGKPEKTPSISGRDRAAGEHLDT